MKNRVISHKKSTNYLIFKKFVDIILRQKLKKGEKMLKKLSLAALVAMGGMSFANATPLTEAIKNVDLNGMLRIRFYNEDPDGQHGYRRWRTNGIFIFKVPVAENLKMVVRNSVQTNVSVHDDNIASNGPTSNVDDTIANNLLFMAYSKDGFNAILGKIPVATPVTSADPVTPGHGAGAIATYKVNDNFTAGAFFIDALKNGGGEGTAVGVPNLIAHNVAGAAAIFNVSAVKGQIWFFNVNNVVDSLVTVSLDAKLPIEYNVGIHVDYANGKLNSDYAKANGVSDDAKNYYNVALNTNIDAFCAKIGYAYTDKHVSPVELAVDAPIGAVITTANNYNIANLQDTSSIYGKLGYNVDPKTNVYVAAQYQNAGDDSANKNNDLAEYTIGGSYKMNKKLSFSAYYDIADWDDNADYNDNNEFRFEAKYTF